MARTPGIGTPPVPKGPLGRPPTFDPTKAVLAAPRIKPISTREYGKGGTPMGGPPDLGVRGGGIGYAGGFNPFGSA
jgi:hypothetical protein